MSSCPFHTLIQENSFGLPPMTSIKNFGEDMLTEIRPVLRPCYTRAPPSRLRNLHINEGIRMNTNRQPQTYNVKVLPTPLEGTTSSEPTASVRASFAAATASAAILRFFSLKLRPRSFFPLPAPSVRCLFLASRSSFDLQGVGNTGGG